MEESGGHVVVLWPVNFLPRLNTELVYSHFLIQRVSPAARLLQPEAGEGETEQTYLPNCKWILGYFKSQRGGASDGRPRGVLDGDAVMNKGKKRSCGKAVGVMNKRSRSSLIVVTWLLNIPTCVCRDSQDITDSTLVRHGDKVKFELDRSYRIFGLNVSAFTPREATKTC